MQEKSLIKKNIIQYLELKGVSKYKFYQETGITRGVLDQNNGMSEENTARIIAYYTEISPEWLLTGKGQMLKRTEEYGNQIVHDPAPIYSNKKEPVNDSIIYKLYKEEKEETKKLHEEIGSLKEKIRQMEAEYLNSERQIVNDVSKTKTNKSNLPATSAIVRSKK